MADNRIHITFSTTAGDLEKDFPVNQPLQSLKREVMARLKLDPSQATQYIVVLNGNPLDESKTLAELHIAAGSVLTIERREVVKV